MHDGFASNNFMYLSQLTFTKNVKVKIRRLKCIRTMRNQT
jgi:hypothetical protein